MTTSAGSSAGSIHLRKITMLVSGESLTTAVTGHRRTGIVVSGDVLVSPEAARSIAGALREADGTRCYCALRLRVGKITHRFL